MRMMPSLNFRKALLSAAFLLQVVPAWAQYTYIGDRRFYETADLVGYEFFPSMKEEPGNEQEEIEPGAYTFVTSFSNLYVKGQGIEGVYNINNIQPEEYGFKLTLMNARNARLQGHLKIIQNKYGMVESLIFKRASTEPEIIFYLPAIPTKLRDQEKAYFTDRGELLIPTLDSVWGKTLVPFLLLHKDANVQQRLRMGDSTSITFVKKVKKLEEKDRKKNKAGQVAADSLGAAAAEPALSRTGGAADSLGGQAGKPKVEEEFFVVLNITLLHEDGTARRETREYPVRRTSEREDKEAGQMEERYRWEFVTDDKEKIMLFLNGDHSVSSASIGDKLFLMRGF
jgi:hypothetical protein